jgi:hypothetical protein
VVTSLSSLISLRETFFCGFSIIVPDSVNE